MKSLLYFAATLISLAAICIIAAILVASNANAATTAELDYQPRTAVVLDQTARSRVIGGGRITVSSRRSMILLVWPRQATLEDCNAALDLMVENELPAIRAMGRIVHSRSFCAPMEENDADGKIISPDAVIR